MTTGVAASARLLLGIDVPYAKTGGHSMTLLAKYRFYARVVVGGQPFKCWTGGKASRLLNLELAIAKLVVERTFKYEVDYELLCGQTIS